MKNSTPTKIELLQHIQELQDMLSNKDKWMPISTAPKSGKMILGFFSPLESPFRPFQKDGDMAVIWYAGKACGWVMPGVMGLTPTAWQPLPAPME